MKNDLPKYASAFIDNRGKERIRLRRAGWRSVYVQADLGSPQFTVEYHDWLKHGKLEAGAGKMVRGTFDDLISQFYRSPEWGELKKSTRSAYRGELERFRAKYGERSARTMQARHIENLLGAMRETPSAANNLRKRLSQLFDFAIRRGWRTDNPTKAVRSLKPRKGGFPTWQETHIAQFEAAHPIGTKARLVFDLALYTAQRRSDIAIMGPQHIESGRIRVRQLKTDKTLLIPVHPSLAASFNAAPTGHLAFIVSRKGAPYTKESLGNWFRKQANAAGLKGYSLHGLRKAAARRMAERGLSNQLIKSITGHTTDSEVSRYTAEADQVKKADEAMKNMASSDV